MNRCLNRRCGPIVKLLRMILGVCVVNRPSLKRLFMVCLVRWPWVNATPCLMRLIVWLIVVYVVSHVVVNILL